jgi:hypothetical protein
VPHLRKVVHVPAVVSQAHAVPHGRQAVHLQPVRAGIQGAVHFAGSSNASWSELLTKTNERSSSALLDEKLGINDRILNNFSPEKMENKMTNSAQITTAQNEKSQ